MFATVWLKADHKNVFGKTWWCHMLFTGSHQTEEAGERSGDVSLDVDFVTSFSVTVSAYSTTYIEYCTQQYVLLQLVFTTHSDHMRVLLEFPGSYQARVKRRPWRTRTTWPTWSPRTYLSTWTCSAWTRGATRAPGDSRIPWTARERWKAGVCLSSKS